MRREERIQHFFSELQRELENYGLSSLQPEVIWEDGNFRGVYLFYTGRGARDLVCVFDRIFWPSREVAHFLRGLLGERYPEAETPGVDAYPEAFIDSVRNQLSGVARDVAVEIVGGRVYVTADGLRDVFGQGESVHNPAYLRMGLEARAVTGI